MVKAAAAKGAAIFYLGYLNLLGKLDEIDAQGTGISVGGPFANGVPTNADNLVARALQLAQRDAGVHIDKQIPNGGGLGGGSADAAAVLRWAGFTDLVAASRIGADIAFCMVGGRAQVRGIGEVVEPVTPDPSNSEPLVVTLIVPPLFVSTPAVYHAWDELAVPAQRAAINDLEAAAIVVYTATDTSLVELLTGDEE